MENQEEEMNQGNERYGERQKTDRSERRHGTRDRAVRKRLTGRVGLDIEGRKNRKEKKKKTNPKITFGIDWAPLLLFFGKATYPCDVGVHVEDMEVVVRRYTVDRHIWNGTG